MEQVVMLSVVSIERRWVAERNVGWFVCWNETLHDRAECLDALAARIAFAVTEAPF